MVKMTELGATRQLTAINSVNFNHQLTQCHCHDNGRSCDTSSLGVLGNVSQSTVNVN